MRLTQDDYVKKALLETQERIRDYMTYSQEVESTELQHYFREFAKTEAKQAQILQGFVPD